jgi:hypothetical protein
MADTFHIAGTEGMGPDVRRDDGESVVRIALIRASVIAPANSFA